MSTTREIIVETFEDITVLAPGDPLDETEATRALSKVTRLLDNWNAERHAVYASRLTTYTLTPNLQPHTIGPAASSPTFTVTQRPVSVDGANLVLTGSTPAVHYALNLRDEDWWRSLTIPALATSMPTDLYYSADWPLGSIYLWPVPTTAYGLEIQTRIVLADLALDDEISFPPGYRDALIKTLGEMLAPSYPPAVADVEGARIARSRIFSNNDTTPLLTTADWGMPRASDGAPRTTFLYRRGY